jgi:hypothetical protein
VSCRGKGRALAGEGSRPRGGGVRPVGSVRLLNILVPAAPVPYCDVAGDHDAQIVGVGPSVANAYPLTARRRSVDGVRPPRTKRAAPRPGARDAELAVQVAETTRVRAARA